MLNTRPTNDGMIVYCAGSLILGEEADALCALVRKLLPDCRVIILHLAGITMMDSAGIGTLVGLSFSARNAGVSLKLARPTARIHTLFQLTHLDPVFEIVDTPEPAAAAGGASP
jgi:anti-sigma B factor antagonist